jgi:hypothetical protein
VKKLCFEKITWIHQIRDERSYLPKLHENNDKPRE